MQLPKQKIAELLEQTIGLNISSIGDSSFQRALSVRMRVLGIGDITAYYDKLTASFGELRKLVEEVTVPETWFFRDQEPFVFLTKHILNSEKNLSRSTYRILSLPCSTGEEPYSIAMTLLEAGLKPSNFFIDAVDVSERVLAKARKGVYGKNSFRTEDLRFRDRFFFKTAEEFSLRKMVREKVRFLQGNIMQPGFMQSLGFYDVVFCRNVLIYFNKDGQKQAINTIYNQLVADGLLFTGHAEAGLFIDGRFGTVTHTKSFAFYKRSEAQAKLQRRKKVTAVPTSFARRPELHQVKPSLSQPVKQQNCEFALVRKLADEGRLKEAASRSEDYLRLNRPSARWYHLLGIIRDSQGRPEEAFKLLRKAVYLDPGNVESLIQLSLLAERAGDLATAANYKRRAKRIHEREENL